MKTIITTITSIVLTMLLTAVPAAAQNITGRLIDESGDPVAYASVVIVSRPDSSYMTGATTAEDGRFTIPAREGEEYDLTASFIGYLDIRMVCTASDLGTLVMKEDTEMLDEVTVIADRTEHDATGYTVNLKAADIVKGKSTSDALAFLPNITEQDGSFKINGLAVSEIYVDGVKLTSSDELKNIPAERIESVKVNFMAGAHQNAAVSGGTISITLTRPPEGGFYGNLMAGGKYMNYGFSGNAGGMLYSRYKNLSIYDNLMMGIGDGGDTGWQSTDGADGSTLSWKDETSRLFFWNMANRLSLNQQIGERNNLGISYYIGYSDSNTTTGTVTDGSGVESAVKGRNSYLMQEVTAKYSSVFNERGTSMDIIADWLGRSYASDYAYSYTGEDDTRTQNETSSNFAKLSVDFSDPISRKVSLSYGLSAQYISSRYTPLDISGSSDGRFYISELPTRTGGLTPLVYISAGGTLWERLRYSLGVNFQMNFIEYQAMDSEMETFHNIQWGINPTLSLMMPLDKNGKHSMSLNYRRTLGDIPYDAISSTIRWIDPYNYSVGNPDLKAETGDMVILGFSLLNNMINISGRYTHTANAIYWDNFQSEEDPDVYYEKPVNINGLNIFATTLDLNFNPLKPWYIKIAGQLYFRPENNISVGGIQYSGTNIRQYYMLRNQLAFKNGWGGSLDLIYEPTYKYFGYTYHKVYNLGGQIYKSFGKGNYMLVLNFNLLGNRRRLDRTVGNQTITHAYTTPVQNIGLTFWWNFSGGKKVSVNAVQGSQSYQEVVNTR